ncbi:AP-5 complex subunit zeta-1 isoform X2 [Ochotona curzoniae]|uniref:AP-5 complex subunit zeta-1 isoform X2 n=1 Tax=Ochotona curzoniae TaxID=130825 RepID=UPI001B34BFEB|nr:AP-5 complex subunit zeta-1 isoform X2 [Ochotona curzoniae]
MLSAAAEGLLQQARELEDEELGRFCSRVTQLLQAEEPGPEATDALQRLFLIISATKYDRRLDRSCVDLLQAAVCSPTGPEQIQVLCAAILREMSPCVSLSLSCERAQSPRQLSLVASVLLAQGDRGRISSVGRHICRVLESRQPEGPGLRHLLPVLARAISLTPGSLQEEHTSLLSKRLLEWLRHASVHQGLPRAGGFFSAPRARQPGPITEVDGAVAADFFTVLSTGQHYTEDQWLNMQAFSMLRAWLLHGGPPAVCPPPTDDKSGLEGSTLSVLSAASSASHLLPPRERLRAVAFEYCQRLIEQSNRRALRKADAELQRACLVEAVLVLDLLCRQDPSFLYRTLACLKTLPVRLSADPTCVRALLPLAQFFLNHGEAAAVDAEAAYQYLFTRVPAELFHSPVLALELVQLCRDNLHLLAGPLGILPRGFPNLLKFLAWNSPALTMDFVALIPALVDAGSAVELLHALLDLPCLAAALDLQLRSLPAPPERPPWDTSFRNPSCLEAFRDPQLQPLFQYLLRAEARGSVERLSPLYQPLQPMASCARVVQCAEAVPILLEAFFSAVTQFADGALANQLALLLLDRSDSLFQVPGFETRVHRVLSVQFLALCRLKPSLVVELARELLDFVGSVSSVSSKASLFTCVVWAVGEYLSVACDQRCTVEQINRFFEALEALLFEVTQSRPSASDPTCPPQVITSLMTTLTKLASRSQDLIPRVSLFLSKLRSWAPGPAHGREGDAVRTRATELLNLLRMPSVAQFVLTPSAEVCQPRYHRDTHTALPLALRTAGRLVEKQASLLPS